MTLGQTSRVMGGGVGHCRGFEAVAPSTEGGGGLEWQETLFFIPIFGGLFFFLMHLFLAALVAARGLSLVAASRGCSSLWWLLLFAEHGLWSSGVSSCGSRTLEHRLLSCGARA